MNTPLSGFRPGLIWLLAAAVLAACGQSEGRSGTTQVAARVNGDEITVHQINALLTKAPETAPASAASRKQQALERLIDQQLAVQQALRRKLDRSPEVVQALAQARAEILGRALADEIARAQAKPTPEETKKYYTAHPELFAERRLFAIEEIALGPQQELPEGLGEFVAKSRSMREIAAWLKSKEVTYAENRGVRAAEQVPLEHLPRLHAMKEGEIKLVDGAPGPARIIRLVAAKAAPVDEKTAAPRIQQFLFNRRVHEELDKEMKHAKAVADIEYRGEFASESSKDAGK